MKIDKGNSTLNTSFGSLLSVCVYILVILYTYMKIDVWIMKKDVDIMSTTMIDHLSDDYIFRNNGTGFNLAIGFTEYDDNPEPILDKKYGSLIFKAYEWGTNETTGKYFVRQEEIPSRPCTEEELGLNEGERTFFPFAKNAVKHMTSMILQLYCTK